MTSAGFPLSPRTPLVPVPDPPRDRAEQPTSDEVAFRDANIQFNEAAAPPHVLGRLVRSDRSRP